MVAVPAALPLTTPADVIEAIAGLLLLQVPPVVVLLKVEVRPTHNVVVPVIVPADGAAFTAIV